jgi:hypothetical protein
MDSTIARDDQNLYLMYAKKIGPQRMAIVSTISADNGLTWHDQVIAEQPFFPKQCLSPMDIFPVIAADGAGGVYMSWALENPDTERIDLFLITSPDHGKTWGKPILLTDRPGARAFPGIATQGPGRVGLVWYETNATSRRLADPYCKDTTPADAGWFVHYAFSADALAASPLFSDTLVQKESVHDGPLEKPQSEVFEVAYLSDGRAVLSYPTGTVDQGKSIFAIQTSDGAK